MTTEHTRTTTPEPGEQPGGEATALWAETAVREAAAQEATVQEAAVREAGHLHRPSREDQVLERIERARRGKARIREDLVTLAHGAGGKATHTLIEAVFLESFRNPLLEPLGDGAVIGDLALTTDSFVVKPLFFPGGDIGDLAVNGTVNDLAMCGATPRYLSAGFILEEGFPIADLRRITASMAAAAQAAGVWIVTGDTKVVENGKADGCYITTAGVGTLNRNTALSATAVTPGDAVIVSGPIGEHGMTIMLARGELDLEAHLTSDTAPLHDLTARLLSACDRADDGPAHGAAHGAVRCLRDATRGGVATVLNEIATASQVSIVLDENAIPVHPAVRGACELLGIDPLYVACEGRMVAVVAADHADAALNALRAHPLGSDAAIIGRAGDDPPGLVLLKTCFGGTRIVDLLVGDPLPRIC
ncbi:hydrogenase expression/formation protein HypE [Microtetraspora sp. NBRC 16547]|uniref:hydrogenase expression/formation protein HypE n=1 Tax=Microtetraspora sp. NBRC 16547 TaxID=3030993 RepID=UPI0024A60161|nr:hydrogenase expression/formation protein HypE [Microtetraspora sp. NBRC 16547]GLW99997.1 hydrogenase expression/formation protein HypE [Microtetraspora sp. NBRC 16547]